MTDRENLIDKLRKKRPKDAFDHALLRAHETILLLQGVIDGTGDDSGATFDMLVRKVDEYNDLITRNPTDEN